MKKWIFVFLLILMSVELIAKSTSESLPDSILGHPTQMDANGQLRPWYKPDISGAGYLHVAQLASEFIKNAPFFDPLGLKMYFITCCFHADDNRQIIAEDWMHNPACVWAGLVQGLVLDFRVYSGDESYVDIVREMLDYQLEHGTTPSDWTWSNVPYASADPFEKDYQGAAKWEHDGMRGDGLYGIEPDKIGELGIAYLKFYQLSEEQRFLDAAIHCADALAKHVRDVRPESRDFVPSETTKSPWPFRVNAQTGVVTSEYCSNVIEPIRLFEELIRIGDRIQLSDQQLFSYHKASDLAWEWLYSINGPMKTSIWNAYFEDVPNDPDRANRIQITPMETARYLIKHPDADPNIKIDVPALIHWVASAFATDGFDAIKEQTWCYFPMGSHTSRYASVCALWYERTGDPWYKNQAERFFNYATYMCHPDGVVSVGHSWPSSWWSDGYSDYIRHFMEGVAAIPEWAPGDENHLLKSTSVIQTIRYIKNTVAYRTYDVSSVEKLRLNSKPISIQVDGTDIKENSESEQDGWTWDEYTEGGVLYVRHNNGKNVEIIF